MIVKAREGEDISRHVRVFARVHKITALIIHLEKDDGSPFVEATIRRTNVPYERRDLVDIITNQAINKLCGLFSVTARHLITNKIEHHTMWFAVEK